jgi:teichuronic acid biosynthesis protein TuaE
MNSHMDVHYRSSIPSIKAIGLFALLIMSLVFFFPVFYTLHQTIAYVVSFIVLLCFIALNGKLKLDKWTAEIYVFMAFWFIYSLIGIAWAKDTIVASNYTRRILTYLLTFVLFSQLARKSGYRDNAYLIFQMVFYAYCLIYIWEMITWQHLPNSRLYGVPLPVPTGVYFNENNSAVFLMLLTPFLTIKTKLTASKTGRVVSLVFFFFSIVAAAVQHSRLALAIMALLGVYYFFRASFFSKLASVVLIIVSLSVFIIGFPKEYNATNRIIRLQISHTINESNSYLMTSSKIRSRLNLESINLAMDSKLFGVGAGGYEIYLGNSRYHKTAWVLNPHNWWLEILANYGLIIFLGFVFMYLRWLHRLWILRHRADRKRFAVYDAYFVSILLFVPFSMIPSSIKGFYSVWIFFGLVHAFCLTADGSGQGCSASTDNKIQSQASA